MTDVPESTSTTASVAIGGSYTGEIETAHDKDWIAVDLVAGRIYQFDLQGASSGQGTLADTFLRRIRDENGIKSLGDGQNRTFNDDFGGTRDSRVTFVPTESGRYYVEVSGDRDETGTYKLTATDVTPVTPEDDYAASTDTAGRVEVGSFTTGEIETAHDKDWIAVELVAGRTYQFDLQGAPSDHGTLADTFLRRIRDENGVKSLGDGQNSTYNDDFEGSLDSRVTFTATASGTYYVEVSGDRDETGTYTLTVADVTPASETETRQETETPPILPLLGTGVINEVVDDEPRIAQQQQSVPAPEDTEDVDVGDSTLARIGFSSPVGNSDGVIQSFDVDQRWFKVELTAGIRYRFEAAPTGRDGQLDIPLITAIYNPDASEITPRPAFYDTGGDRVNSASILDNGFYPADRPLRVSEEFTPTETGTHYIVVSPMSIGIPASKGGYHTGWFTLSVTQTDDYGETIATAGDIEVGGSATGEVVASDRDLLWRDVDWFEVDLALGVQYRIDIKGADTDSGTLTNPYLHGIYNASGNLIANTTDDDSGSGNNSRFLFTPTADGKYYIAAGGFERATGTYRVDVTEVTTDDYAATTPVSTGSGTVTPGSFTTGAIEADSDVDFFKVENVVKGAKYRFEIEGEPTGAGTLADPHLAGLYREGVNVILLRTEDSDSGEGRNSRLEYTFARDDLDFYVAVRGASADARGTYRLTVTQIDDYSADVNTQGTVTVGGSATGRIDYVDATDWRTGDKDWFAVELTGGTRYQVDLKGTHAGGGTLFDPYLGGIYSRDDLENPLDGTTKNDGGISYSSRVFFTAPSTGTYYIEADGAGFHTGTYTLEVDAI